MITQKLSQIVATILIAGPFLAACSPNSEKNNVTTSSLSGAYLQDVHFMQKHTSIVLLEQDNVSVAIAPNYQGRVMTSTFDKQTGPSFGWINRPVIEQGLISDEQAKGKLQQHIYIFGGEERFWLAPEGGQFALFFKPGDSFDFANWYTPPAIDTEPFHIIKQSRDAITFQHSTTIENYHGTQFNIGIERTIRLVPTEDIEKSLGVSMNNRLKLVAYQSDNTITNIGTNAWQPDSGLPAIWILGMYNPSQNTTVVIPLQPGTEQKKGPKVNDSYFGKVPDNYIKVEDEHVYFKGDGTRRGKIGVSDRRSTGIAGSYDADQHILNLVTYNVQSAPNGFANSMWEIQQQPYGGDVINAYNDGSPEPDLPPLGPFYELETSSPAAALAPNQSMQHIQTTYHIHGTPEELEPIAIKTLGTSLKSITNAFQDE